MMIKFSMTSGPSITLSKEQAEKIIDATGQLIRISDGDGKWTGKTINKAHVVSTTVDHDASRMEDIPTVGQLLEGKKERELITY